MLPVLKPLFPQIYKPPIKILLKQEHVSFLFKTLRWHPISLRVNAKVLTVVWKTTWSPLTLSPTITYYLCLHLPFCSNNTGLFDVFWRPHIAYAISSAWDTFHPDFHQVSIEISLHLWALSWQSRSIITLIAHFSPQHLSLFDMSYIYLFTGFSLSLLTTMSNIWVQRFCLLSSLLYFQAPITMADQ